MKDVHWLMTLPKFLSFSLVSQGEVCLHRSAVLVIKIMKKLFNLLCLILSAVKFVSIN